MKKLFLIPLLTLMCSVMAWGTTITVGEGGDHPTFSAALSAAAAGDEIQLVSDISVGYTMVQKALTINLNGHTMSLTGTSYHLLLMLTGDIVFENGVINVDGTYSAFMPFGGNPNITLKNLTVNTSSSVGSVMTYSSSGTVTLIKTTINAGKALSLTNGSTTIDSESTINGSSYGILQTGGSLVVNGATIIAGTVGGSGATCHGIDFQGGTLTIQDGSTIISHEHTGIVVTKNATLNVYGGNISGKVFGISGNGNDKTTTSQVINISGGVIGSETAEAGIYHPQVGTLSISGGTIKGASGIGIKSGTLNITGGSIEAYGLDKTGESYGNGIHATGAALQLESNTSYAGNMAITISNNAVLTSAVGYAIYEYVSKFDDATAVSSIAVSNGKFKNGIRVSQALGSKGAFVSGGKWASDITAFVVSGKAANPITSGEDYEAGYRFEVGEPTAATAEVENEDGKTAVLVADGATPTDEEKGDKETVVTSTATNPVVISENTDVVAAGDKDKVDVKKVTVENGTTLTVKEGATLNVGAGAIHLDEEATTPALVVKSDAAVVVEGLIYGATAENFVLEAEEDKTATVLFSPETDFVPTDHPTATYKFKSKAKQNGDGTCVWQRFGIPTFDGITTMSWPAGVRTAIYSYDYDADKWKQEYIGESSFTTTAANGRPFQCYDMTIDKEYEVEYTFTGSLMGNSNAPLEFVFGWNYYANSYTAPIDIESFINDIKKKYGEVSATVYVYRRSDDWWDEVNMVNLGDDDIPTKINPMQAFILQLRGAESSDAQIDFKNNVYDPIIADMNPGSSHAPKAVRESDFNKVVITATNGTENDKLTLFEQSDLSDAFDNGYDAEKYVEAEKSFSIYHTEDGVKLGTYATNDLSDKFIAFDAKEEGEYTLNFSNVRGDEISLYDAVADSTIIMKAGESYTFHAQAINDAQRFIINANGAPSAIEDVQNVVNATKFIGVDGQLYIRRAGNVYDVQGKEVK